MKTLEFKFHPTPAQVDRLERWLATQKWVWNESVRIIDDFNLFNPYHKPSKCNYPASPITSENPRRWEPRKLWSDEAGMDAPLIGRSANGLGDLWGFRCLYFAKALWGKGLC